MSRIFLFVALLVASLSFISAASIVGYSDGACATPIDGFNVGGFATNSTCAQRTADTNSYLGYTITCTDTLAASTIQIWPSATNPASCDGLPTYSFSGTFDGTACIAASPIFIGASSLKINCNSASGLTVLSSLLVALVALVTKATQWF